MKKNGSLLVIDDEKDIGEILAKILHPYFEKVIYSSNADEALEITQSTKFSVIITDISMPGLPGDQLVRKLRAAGDLTPVVFLTGHSTKELVVSAMRLGVSDVIEKPFDAETLVAKMDMIIEIERRKENVHGHHEQSKESVQNEKKVLGLLQVVNESKKKVS